MTDNSDFSYGVSELLQLMKCLRDPEFGCPWDREQTLESIAPYTIEEVYEVVDAIDREDIHHLKEELGDLLFQVVFYAQIASEKQEFNFDDVVNGLVEKFLRRHPHVFPDGSLQSFGKSSDPLSKEKIAASWEAIKRSEKQDSSKEERDKPLLLDDVPVNFPAILRAEKLQKKASKVGFDWSEASYVLDQVQSELNELRDAIEAGDYDAMEDEMGDVFFSCVNLSRKMNINADKALRRTNRKFEQRFGYIERKVKSTGGTLSETTLEKMEALWLEAKEEMQL